MYTPAQKLQMAWGKVRRFLMSQRNYEKALAKREGHCTRCGACCKLLFTCPFLIEDPAKGIFACSIHQKKPSNCVRFPIDARDLADRDIVMPEVKCGYTFPDGQASPIPLAKTGD